MSNTVPAQHPAVVLRSSYRHLRALLAIATIAIVGLTVAVVVLAIGNGARTPTSPATRANPPAISANPSAVTANPDQRGLNFSQQLNGPQPATTSDYPGHR